MPHCLILRNLFSSASCVNTDDMSLTTILEVFSTGVCEWDFMSMQGVVSLDDVWEFWAIRAVGLRTLPFKVSIEIELRFSIKLSVVVEFKFATKESSGGTIPPF